VPFEFLTQLERERYQRVPLEPASQDLLTYTQLSEPDQILISQQRRPANRLGFAVQLTLIRWLAYLPEQWWKQVPYTWITRVGEQLAIDPVFFVQYG